MGRRHGPRERVERLSVSDVGNLYADRPGMPMQVALLARLGGARPGGGAALTDEIAAAIGSRLDAAPRLRQRVEWPRWGRGRPYWLDDPGFSIGDHVRNLELDAPGDEATLLRTCAALGAEVLDRSRPLWELRVVTGLAGGGAAVYFRLHHAVADGLAALATMGALLDLPAGDGAVRRSGAWVPRPAPPDWVLVSDNLLRRAHDVAHALAYLLRPVESTRHLGAVVRSAVVDLAGMRRVPRCSINRHLGPRRSLHRLHVPLAGAKAVGHAVDGSVNDVILAVVAGGLHALFEHRRERISGPIVVSVPMSTRAAGDTGSGNQVSIVPVPVPVDERSDAARLAEIVRTTRARKEMGRVSGYTSLSSELMPLRLQRRIMNAMATGDQRMVNLFVTNVPGPPGRMRLAGRDLVDAYPVAPIAGNVTIGVAVLSYAGELYVIVHADPDVNPDVDVMADAMRDSFATLLATPGRTEEVQPSWRSPTGA